MQKHSAMLWATPLAMPLQLLWPWCLRSLPRKSSSNSLRRMMSTQQPLLVSFRTQCRCIGQTRTMDLNVAPLAQHLWKDLPLVENWLPWLQTPSALQQPSVPSSSAMALASTVFQSLVVAMPQLWMRASSFLVVWCGMAPARSLWPMRAPAPSMPCHAACWRSSPCSQCLRCMGSLAWPWCNPATPCRSGHPHSCCPWQPPWWSWHFSGLCETHGTNDPVKGPHVGKMDCVRVCCSLQATSERIRTSLNIFAQLVGHMAHRGLCKIFKTILVCKLDMADSRILCCSTHAPELKYLHSSWLWPNLSNLVFVRAWKVSAETLSDACEQAWQVRM